jgi:hypothetical protein
MLAPLPPVPASCVPSFYYFSLWNCAVYYLVDPAVVRPHLEGTGLEPAIFGGRASVSFNFQLYTSQFPQGASVTNELELNVVAQASARSKDVPAVTLGQFLLGDEQTKIVGHRHVHVPCDNPHAVAAGRDQFGEPKFLTTFTTALPSLNDPTVATWRFTCHDPDQATSVIFACTVDVRGLTPTAGNVSPITEYGTVAGRLVAARWNLFQPVQTYLLGADAGSRVQLTYGDSAHAMRRDMQALIGELPAAAVCTLQPAPVAVQSRAFYPAAPN